MDRREYCVGDEIADAQWALVKPYFSEYVASGRGGQKPEPVDKRACFEAVFWMAHGGARWKDLPRYFYPPIGGRRLSERCVGGGLSTLDQNNLLR